MLLFLIIWHICDLMSSLKNETIIEHVNDEPDIGNALIRLSEFEEKKKVLFKEN